MRRIAEFAFALCLVTSGMAMALRAVQLADWTLRSRSQRLKRWPWLRHWPGPRLERSGIEGNYRLIGQIIVFFALILLLELLSIVFRT